MKTFDPWPVFFRREFNRNWPFLVGFAMTGFLFTKHAMSLTEEDAKKSKFAQRHKKYDWFVAVNSRWYLFFYDLAGNFRITD